MTRKKEILIGSIIVLAIIGFFGIKILDLSFDREGVLGKIDEAIESGNTDYLKSHLEVRGLDRDLTDKEVENIGEALRGISVYSLSDGREDPDANIYIKKKGKEKLIFDKYIIVLKPYDLTIASNIEGTKVFIDGEEVGVFKEDEDFVYRDLLPGKHRVKINYKGEYADIEEEEEILALNREGTNEIYLDLKVSGRYIHVESNLEDAKLFINGEDTGVKIYEEYELGPLDEKKKIKISARARIDGKDYESDIVEITSASGNYHTLNIDYQEPMSKEEVMRDVKALIGAYEVGLIDAVNYGSYTYIDDYIEYASPFMKAQKKLISNLYEKGTEEDLLSYEIEDISILSQQIVSVTVRESHMIYYKSGDKKQVDNKWVYTVVNIDDEFYIRDIKAAK